MDCIKKEIFDNVLKSLKQERGDLKKLICKSDNVYYQGKYDAFLYVIKLMKKELAKEEKELKKRNDAISDFVEAISKFNLDVIEYSE